ncbi:MAG: type II toxin-antitoxin system prevent-host-death family antitoxin [Verrucomicrobiae bacterium]|nr:type II toxin-antitoxin system prevent-host-death family antitoxin [Verrucomicrobiae bacterium]
MSTKELVNDAPALVLLIKQGEEVTLTENGQQLAKVLPIQPRRRTPRPVGLARGQFKVPSDFNAPLPDHVLRVFEGA